MNNNDFYGNLDRIRKLYLKQNYDDAIKLADKMDFKRLKDWKYIAMLINLYEAVGRLEDVKYFCILAYNRNLGGKKLLYKLTKVMIMLEDIDEAEELYEEYTQMTGRDNKKYELLYELKVIQGAKRTELIKILEDYMKRDIDDKYSYKLAELYAKSKQNEKCVNLCDKIIDRYEGNAVADKARALKNAVANPQMAGQAQVETSKTNAKAGYNSEMPAQNMYVTQDIPVQDLYVTQDIPVQDMYATQDIPVQDMYATQDIPVQDMYVTQDIPMQDMYVTQDIPMQDMYVTQDIPMQDIPAQSVQANTIEEVSETEISVAETLKAPLDENAPEAPAVEEQDLPDVTGEAIQQELPLDDMVGEPVAAEVAEAVSETMEEEASEEEIKEAVAAELESNPFVINNEQSAVTDNTTEIDMPKMVSPMGTTVRVDTEAVNAAIREAAATMDNQDGPHMENAPDIESTMAMVEAALATETQAAQFEARMDMPEYSEEYAAPVKEKVTLRAFQPEIDKVYEIPMEVKRYFTKYSSVSGLEAQVGEYFESTKYEEKMGTSAIGNIIISGNRSSDKTTLAINIVKSLNIMYPDKARKIARTTGDNINQRGIERSIGKLLGTALIVEEAGVMDRQRILELVEVMESDTQELLIILEDSESEINELLKNNPELIEKFNHRITFKQFTVNELVEMCKRYADKCHYAIDEKALLQLYLRIDDIHSNGEGVSLEDVRDVVDTAMENAQRRANKKLFGGVKKKRVGDKDYVVLIESDFKE